VSTSETASPGPETARPSLRERESASAPGVTRWRKRPVTIEAVQLVDDPAKSDPGWEAIADWCGGRLRNHEIADSGEYETVLVIPTLEGDMTAVGGDWIIKGVAGEFYPCQDHIFQRTYEPAGSPPPAGDQVTVSRGDLWTALTTNGVLPDAVYDRLCAAAEVTR
jgi:hypothetical protein